MKSPPIRTTYATYRSVPRAYGHCSRGRAAIDAAVKTTMASSVTGSCATESTRYSRPCAASAPAPTPVCSFAYAVLGNGKP
jgi:hypothetical protein